MTQPEPGTYEHRVHVEAEGEVIPGPDPAEAEGTERVAEPGHSDDDREPPG